MKRGQKASPFVKFVKKYGLVPKKKANGATSTQNSKQTRNTAQSKNSSMHSAPASTYSIGGDQDVEADLAKKTKGKR